MVLITKYRHPVLVTPVKECLYSKIREVFNERGVNILEMNGEKDHVHILFEADPFTAPGELTHVVKTQSSRFVRKFYGETVLKKWYWKPYFWAESYFACTVSERSAAAVQEYIKNQKG